jgi:hypothetical protein
MMGHTTDSKVSRQLWRGGCNMICSYPPDKRVQQTFIKLFDTKLLLVRCAFCFHSVPRPRRFVFIFCPFEIISCLGLYLLLKSTSYFQTIIKSKLNVMLFSMIVLIWSALQKDCRSADL